MVRKLIWLKIPDWGLDRNVRSGSLRLSKIDKTVFNESAGSRKQTYSRLRLAPPLSPHSANMRRHRQTLKYAPTAVSLPNDNIAVASENSNELAENSEIVSVLKGLFRSSLDENGDGEGDVIVEEGDVTVKESEVVENDVVMSPEPSESGNVDESAVLGSASVAKRVKAAEEEAVMSPEPVTAVLPEEEMMESTETKKKRGRPRKSEGGNGEGNEVLVSALSVAKRVRARARESSVMKVVEDYDRDKDKEVVNSRGEEVDVVKLGELDDPYGPEIGRRTEGMSSVDEFLEFFRGLNGQWGTTRKKRRVVDASEFGDCLPKGWRLSLCIKRKDGRVWVFCRRYIRFGFRFSYIYDLLIDID
ncbi:zinc finger, C2H2-like, DNA-binding domain protein [Artemisia annua]|uniref:Zinc finger, C2H2-like, DNA-binding domain protein n=1 Tax=Artemisia annua TaxID=35608 RepID=A0A2U1PA49_ARTAN|nr:zinc finger, C2H2-like, DNA-binding domain protein [Artemisia annua]